MHCTVTFAVVPSFWFMPSSFASGPTTGMPARSTDSDLSAHTRKCAHSINIYIYILYTHIAHISVQTFHLKFDSIAGPSVTHHHTVVPRITKSNHEAVASQFYEQEKLSQLCDESFATLDEARRITEGQGKIEPKTWACTRRARTIAAPAWPAAASGCPVDIHLATDVPVIHLA